MPTQHRGDAPAKLWSFRSSFVMSAQRSGLFRSCAATQAFLNVVDSVANCNQESFRACCYKQLEYCASANAGT